MKYIMDIMKLFPERSWFLPLHIDGGEPYGNVEERRKWPCTQTR